MLARRSDVRASGSGSDFDVKKSKRSLFSFGSRAATSNGATAELLGPATPPKDVNKEKLLLRSSSSPGELPQDWPTYNKAYATGKMDFNDPPPPPSKLENVNRAPSGQYRAPTPVNEKRRQRAVESLGMVNRTARTQVRRPASGNSSSSSSDSSSSAGESTSASSAASSLLEPFPKDLSSYETLQGIAERAAKRFGTGVCSISLMDDDQQVFLAEVGLGVPELNRECTVCSHALLKATTGQQDPFVVLNLSRDWRFLENNFGTYARGFYASVPLTFPAPFGDPTPAYPGGIFCILDDKPRTHFSDEERADIASFAAEAGVEIARYQAELQQTRNDILVVKRDEWRRSRLFKAIASKPALDTVVEVVTPPASPEFVSKRPSSLVRTLTAESANSSIPTTEVTPTFCKRGNGHSGLHATAAPDSVPYLDLSTRILGESLDLDFIYLLAITLPEESSSGSSSPMTSKQLRLLSSHNSPVPAPLFDVQLHIETLVSANNALLFSDPTCVEGEFATGLLVKVSVVDGVGYILGGFSENRRRVLNRQDFLFFRAFAADLASKF